MTYAIVIFFVLSAVFGCLANANNQAENYNALFYAALALVSAACGVVGLIIKWVV